MKSKKLIAVILVILTVAYCAIALLAYDASSSVEILCIPGSKAELWAKDHHADYSLIAESDIASAELQLGTFDYNLENGKCVITGCHSVSDEIVIPKEIDGCAVIGVEKTAFDSCQNVKTVFVPKSVEQFVPLHTDRYVIRCYEDSATYSQLQEAVAEKIAAENLKAAAEAAPGLADEAEKEAQRCAAEADEAEAAAKAAQEEADEAAKLAAEPDSTETVIAEANQLAAQAAELAAAAEEKRSLANAAAEIATQKREEAWALAAQLAEVKPEVFVVAPFEKFWDSDPVNFLAADIPFSYNQSGNKIELTAYTGKSAQVVIPETIDGLEVTAISFPVEPLVESVLIPATVTDIRSPLTEPRYDTVFFCNLALVVLGLVIALTATGMAAKRSRTAEQRFLGVPVVYAGIKYDVLLLLWAAVSLFRGFGLWMQVLVGLVLLAAAPIELAIAGTAARTVEKTGADIRRNTMFIRAYRNKADGLEARAADAVKADCRAVAEAFRYADPVSHASLMAVEEQIQESFEVFSAAVLDGKEAETKAAARNLVLLIEERNRTCKLLK